MGFIAEADWDSYQKRKREEAVERKRKEDEAAAWQAAQRSEPEAPSFKPRWVGSSGDDGTTPTAPFAAGGLPPWALSEKYKAAAPDYEQGPRIGKQWNDLEEAPVPRVVKLPDESAPVVNPKQRLQEELYAATKEGTRDIGGRVSETLRSVQEPVIEGLTRLGMREPLEGPTEMRQAWQERGEPFPGYKGGIEMATDPLNAIPGSVMGRAGRAVKDVAELGLAGRALKGAKAAVSAPELQRFVPAAPIEDVGKVKNAGEAIEDVSGIAPSPAAGSVTEALEDVGDVIKPGDLIKTSYSSTPLEVVSEGSIKFGKGKIEGYKVRLPDGKEDFVGKDDAVRYQGAAAIKPASEIAEDVSAPVMPRAASPVARRALPPMTDNYLKPLSEYTDTLYREVGAEGAEELLPSSRTMASLQDTEPYFSNTPDIALGQGASKGILLTFDSGAIKGQVNRAKPTWQLLYDQGQAEFIGKHNPQSVYQNALRSVTIKPNAKMDRVAAARLKGGLKGLEDSGWAKTVGEDGSIVYERPATTAPADAPEPELPRTAAPVDEAGGVGAAAAPPLKPPEPPTAQAAMPGPEPPTGSIGPPIRPDSSLPTVKATSEILEAAYTPDVVRRVVDKLDNPITRVVAQGLGVPKRDVFTQGAVLRETIMADWKSAVTGAVAKVRQFGDSKALFSADKDGLVAVNGRKVALNDLLEHPDRYALTAEQQKYTRALHQLYDDQKLALAAEGIDIRTLSFEEGGHYVGRRVLGKIDDATGNVEIAQVSGRGGRVGAKPGFEKARSFDTQEEALKKGFRYLSPEEALQMNLQAAGRQIADKRLADFIMERIPYRTGAAPEELKLARDFAQKKLAAVGTLKAVVNRGYRGERVPPATIASIGRHFPEAARGLIDAGITKLETPPLKPLLRDQLQSVEAMVPALKAQSQAAFYKAKSALAEAGEKARASHYGEGSVQAPAFQGKFFSTEDAKKLNKILDLERPSALRGAAESISWVNALPRLLMTTFDLGPAFIQGQMALFSHPIVWGKAWGRAMQGLASEKGMQSFLAAHADTIKNWSRDGAIFTPSEFTETALKTGAAGKIPVLRDVVKPFARTYESYLNATRIYGLEATEHLAKTPQDRVGLAKFWNEMSGQVDTAKMGIGATQRAVETAVLFAPRYRRAVLALMTDIAKGGLRGKMARDAVAKTVVGGVAGYMGVWTLAHQIDPKGNPAPHLDPREGGKFMTINIGGQNIGFGGAFYSTTRTLLNMTLEPDKAHEHAAKYVMNSVSPAIGTLTEAVRFPYQYQATKAEEKQFGRFAQPLKITKKVVGESLLPIWAQSLVLEEGNAGTPAALAAELFGGRTFADKENAKQTSGDDRVQQYLKQLRSGGSSSTPTYLRR